MSHVAAFESKSGDIQSDGTLLARCQGLLNKAMKGHSEPLRSIAIENSYWIDIKPRRDWAFPKRIHGGVDQIEEKSGVICLHAAHANRIPYIPLRSISAPSCRV